MPTKSASWVGVASVAGVPSPICPRAATELQCTIRLRARLAKRPVPC